MSLLTWFNRGHNTTTTNELMQNKDQERPVKKLKVFRDQRKTTPHPLNKNGFLIGPTALYLVIGLKPRHTHRSKNLCMIDYS